MSVATSGVSPRRHVLRRERVDGAGGRRSDHQRARRVGTRLGRGALPGSARACHVRARRQAGRRSRRDLRLCATGCEANGGRGGAADDAHRPRRRTGKGVRAVGVADLGAAQPPLRGRPVRRASSSAGASCSRPTLSYSELFYNVACCESLAGRTEDAIEDLRRAIALSERSRAYAKQDSDFDPIRDEPAFQELVGLNPEQ